MRGKRSCCRGAAAPSQTCSTAPGEEGGLQLSLVKEKRGMSRNLCWGEGRSRSWRWHRAAVAACHGHAGLQAAARPLQSLSGALAIAGVLPSGPLPPPLEREHGAMHRLPAALLPGTELPWLHSCPPARLPHHAVARQDLAPVFALACTSVSGALEAAGRGRHVPEDDEHY